MDSPLADIDQIRPKAALSERFLLEKHRPQLKAARTYIQDGRSKCYTHICEDFW